MRYMFHRNANTFAHVSIAPNILGSHSRTDIFVTCRKIKGEEQNIFEGDRLHANHSFRKCHMWARTDRQEWKAPDRAPTTTNWVTRCPKRGGWLYNWHFGAVWNRPNGLKWIAMCMHIMFRNRPNTNHPEKKRRKEIKEEKKNYDGRE